MSPLKGRRRVDVWHRALMAEYYGWVAWWETECERFGIGYLTETHDFTNRHPRPTFKAFLMGRTQPQEIAA